MLYRVILECIYRMAGMHALQSSWLKIYYVYTLSFSFKCMNKLINLDEAEKVDLGPW